MEAEDAGVHHVLMLAATAEVEVLRSKMSQLVEQTKQQSEKLEQQEKQLAQLHEMNARLGDPHIRVRLRVTNGKVRVLTVPSTTKVSSITFD